MINFKREQIVEVKESGLVRKGVFEVVDVVPTIQGYYNIIIQDIKTEEKIKVGASLLDKALYKIYEKGEIEIENGKITNTSEWAEEEVIKNVRYAFRSKSVKDGDVWKRFYINEEDPNSLVTAKIEVKSANSSCISKNRKNNKALTLNQIRPIKYHIIVAVVHNLLGFSKDCVVYPANYIIRTSLNKKGQHSRDSLMVVNRMCKPEDQEKFGCSFDELSGRIKEAYLEADADLEVKKIVEKRDKLYDIIEEENMENYRRLNNHNDLVDIMNDRRSALR